MQTMNQHLFQLVKEGTITQEGALSVSNNPNDLRIMFQTQMPGPSPTPTPPKPSGLEGRYGKV
jgi:Tfp pilus assembly ATPase PilU